MTLVVKRQALALVSANGYFSCKYCHSLGQWFLNSVRSDKIQINGAIYDPTIHIFSNAFNRFKGR